jgi:hypothetical protein
MDSRNGKHDGVEDEESNLVVVVVFAGDVRGGRKSSPKVRRKPSYGELRRPICGATFGGSKNGLYFWNHRIEGYAGIYIVVGFGYFGNPRYFSKY